MASRTKSTIDAKQHKDLNTNQTATEDAHFLQLQPDTAINSADHGIWIMDGDGVVLK